MLVGIRALKILVTQNIKRSTNQGKDQVKTYKFTLVIKEYFDHEVQAGSEDEARELFLRGDWKDELDLTTPSETETLDFVEEV